MYESTSLTRGVVCQGWLENLAVKNSRGFYAMVIDWRQMQSRFRRVTNYPCVKGSGSRFPRCAPPSNQLSNRLPLFPVSMIYTGYRIDEQICQMQ